jgi:hypothetical protein
MSSAVLFAVDEVGGGDWVRGWLSSERSEELACHFQTKGL